MKKVIFSVFISMSLFFPPPSVYSATCTPTVTEGESIQDAVDSASSGDTICIGVGTYTENITLKDNITIEGEELARTVIDGDGAGTVVSGKSSATIKNIIITNGDVGVLVAGITGLTLQNVVILDNNTGLTCSDNATFSVIHSVLDQNTTGIFCSSESDPTIENAIISNNGTDIDSDVDLTIAGLNNLLYNNDITNYPAEDTTSIFDENPLFVNNDLDVHDYHLQTDSPAIDKGSGTDPDGTDADIGAYGGSDRDPTPYPVAGIGATVTNDVIDITWSANNAYNISGYKVYFDTDQSGEPYEGSANEGDSPIDTGDTTNFTLSGISFPSVSLSAPGGLSAQPGNESIHCSWNEVSGATGYTLLYGTPSGNYTNSIDVGDTTTHTIENLINNITYYIAVQAYNQPTVFISVSAYDDTVANPNESALVNEQTALLSGRSEGPISSEITEFPEETVPFPNLEDENKCFIATAAYGSGMEQDVVLLREFRNEKLLTNKLGRKLVAIYYRTSPPVADYIRRHGWLQPIVRAHLFPLIAIARFSLWISPAHTSLVLLIVAMILTAIVLKRIRKST